MGLQEGEDNITAALKISITKEEEKINEKLKQLLPVILVHLLVK